MPFAKYAASYTGMMVLYGWVLSGSGLGAAWLPAAVAAVAAGHRYLAPLALFGFIGTLVAGGVIIAVRTRKALPWRRILANYLGGWLLAMSIYLLATWGLWAAARWLEGAVMGG